MVVDCNVEARVTLFSMGHVTESDSFLSPFLHITLCNARTVQTLTALNKIITFTAITVVTAIAAYGICCWFCHSAMGSRHIPASLVPVGL